MLAGGEHATLSRIVGLFGVAPQHWLQTFPLLMIIIVNTWRGIATAMILLTAGLSAIPAEVYEAARMDGATPRQIFRRITLPLMMPTIFLYMLISTVATIAIFGLVYALTRGGPGGATEVISIYIYNQSFTAYQLGYGAAVAVVVLGISLILGIVYVRVLKVEVCMAIASSRRAEATSPTAFLVVISIFCLLPFVWVLLASVDRNAAVPADGRTGSTVDALHQDLHQGERRRAGSSTRCSSSAARPCSSWSCRRARRLCAVAHQGLVEAARSSTRSC